MEFFIQQIVAGYHSLSWLETVAVLCGIASAWLSKNRNILVYPVGLVSVGIYVYLCFVNGLYADTGINIFYAGMSIYGWARWITGKRKDNRVVIGRLTPRSNLIFIGASAFFWITLYLLLTRFTDSTVPILDSFTTGLSITGMILMAEKKIESWIYWIIVDVVSIPMFGYKGLYLTTIQFLVFTILAVMGYCEWQKVLQHSEKNKSN